MGKGYGNLRNAKYDTSSGKDVKSTSQLKGEAKITSAFKEKNSTTEYHSGGSQPKDKLGGKDTKS